MFDTHCHLNFAAFNYNLDEVIQNAKAAGVTRILIPGTDYETSKKATEIAEKNEGVYSAVGIHPHHVMEFNVKRETYNVKEEIKKVETLLQSKKAVAIGEVGIDRHYYRKTKYLDYQVNEEFIELQKTFFIEQIKLAGIYKKTLIIHNREAKKDLLELLTVSYQLLTTIPVVFHCCEPDQDLLDFAIQNNIFLDWMET